MTKDKTLEERFLKMYDEITDRNAYLEMKIKSLTEELDKIKGIEPQEENNYIYLTNTPYYYYSVDMESVYNWNEILKHNGETPDLVEQAIEDENKFQRLCELKGESYWRSPIARITEKQYDYLFKDRKGDKYVIVMSTNSDDDMYRVDRNGGGQYYSTKEKAEAYLYEEMAKRINEYLEDYKGKFDNE